MAEVKGPAGRSLRWGSSLWICYYQHGIAGFPSSAVTPALWSARGREDLEFTHITQGDIYVYILNRIISHTQTFILIMSKMITQKSVSQTFVCYFPDATQQHIHFEVYKYLNALEDKYLNVEQYKLLSVFSIIYLDCVIGIGTNLINVTNLLFQKN